MRPRRAFTGLATARSISWRSPCRPLSEWIGSELRVTVSGFCQPHSGQRSKYLWRCLPLAQRRLGAFVRFAEGHFVLRPEDARGVQVRAYEYMRPSPGLAQVVVNQGDQARAPPGSVSLS